MKRVKNCYLKSNMPKTSYVYPTNKFLTDGKSKFQIFYRGSPRFFVDIPTGVNDMGILYKNYFIFTFKCHPYTLDLGQKVDNYNKLIKKNKLDLEKHASNYVETYKQNYESLKKE